MTQNLQLLEIQNASWTRYSIIKSCTIEYRSMNRGVGNETLSPHSLCNSICSCMATRNLEVMTSEIRTIYSGIRHGVQHAIYKSKVCIFAPYSSLWLEYDVFDVFPWLGFSFTILCICDCLGELIQPFLQLLGIFKSEVCIPLAEY